MIFSKEPPNIPRLQRWMESQGLHTVWDISTWKNEAPNCWAVPKCPVNLEGEKNQLLIHLAGIAPLSKLNKESRGWGPGNYTSSEGYMRYVAKINVLVNPKIWN